ncbi:hypothetical protein FIU87_03560 [Bacillus sp. THAF10]|uniref:hypothetical protein n=1 Tax=Bacillus sp. THAF10 TaxID=2587848 RepID=UPI0012A9594B|nr:hypothetical protein [Bacillus sp. THAF10]QFT87720.1 hypothetical protein FIU87_03560 [Bacillus sp. THAF10]
MRLKVENTTENTIFLTPFIIKGDAVYNLEEIMISDDTTITGIGFKAFQIQNKKDLKKRQWVRIWFTKDDNQEKHAEKIVVFNLF